MSRAISNFGRNLVRTTGEIVNRVGGFNLPSPNRTPAALRLSSCSPYETREWMLCGDIYKRRSVDGIGNLVGILRTLGKPSDADAPPIIPYYNPVPAIVGCYSNALGGRLGRDLKVETPAQDPLPKATDDAISRIWRWSNLDTRLGEFTEMLSNQGTVGIRVASDGDRVHLIFDPPSIIAEWEEDSRGNVVWVVLEYTGYEQPAPFQPEQPVEVAAFYGRDRFSVTVGGKERLTPEQQINTLGVCPYVIARHQRRNGSRWGVHAYEGSENAIHGINWSLSQLDEATARAINETVFMAGAGEAPTEVALGRLTAMYVKLAAGIPAPELKYIVPQLAIGETGDSIIRNVELLWTRQPQLILNAMKLLSGVSGETLAQMLKPVESEIERARRLYEDAMVRAVMIAESVGIVDGLWNLGTGTGSKEAADRAYDDGQGKSAFAFKDRPLLPPTVYQKIQQATADTAEQLAKFTVAAAASKVVGDREEILRIAGYDDAKAKELALIPLPVAQPAAAPGTSPAPAANTASPASPRVNDLLSRLG